jgi:hypothetical protein
MPFAGVLVLALVGCGSKTPVDLAGGTDNVTDAGRPDARAPLPPLPPGPAVCELAMSAIDWSECPPSPHADPERGHRVQCAQYSATPTCGQLHDEYYRCLANEQVACMREGTTWWIEGNDLCDEAPLLNCVSDCNDGYFCSGKPGQWIDCECGTDSPRVGEACAVYPNLVDGLPNCPSFCSSCR